MNSHVPVRKEQRWTQYTGDVFMLSKGQITPLCTLQYFLGVGVGKSEGENWMNTQHRVQARPNFKRPRL